MPTWNVIDFVDADLWQRWALGQWTDTPPLRDSNSQVEAVEPPQKTPRKDPASEFSFSVSLDPGRTGRRH